MNERMNVLFPDESLVAQLTEGRQWEGCLDVWILAMSQKLAQLAAPEPQDLLWLQSYLANSDKRDGSAKEHVLSEKVFFYLHFLLSTDPPRQLLDYTTLINFTYAYGAKNSTVMRELFHGLWSRHHPQLRREFNTLKRLFLLDLSGHSHESPSRMLCMQLSTLIAACPPLFEVLFSERKELEVLFRKYNESTKYPEQEIFCLVKTCGDAVLKCVEPNLSKYLNWFLTDYDHTPSLIVDILLHTDFSGSLHRLPDHMMSLVTMFEAIVAANTNDTEAMNVDTTLHQLRDMFPDHSVDYLQGILLQHGDDLGLATSHLIETPKEAPAKELPPTRRNIFDNDEVDRLHISPTLIHRGRKEGGNADLLLKSPDANKAAIYAAIDRFDADDDERDDTYDAIGGDEGIEAKHADELPDTKPKPTDKPQSDDSALFHALEGDAAIFQRTGRKSKARQELRNKTGMSDEQIEGWKFMLDRDPKSRDRLMDQMQFSGQQTTLPSTSYRKKGAEESESEGAGPSRSGNGTEAKNTGQRNPAKSKGKSSRTNRRDQHAKKVDRAAPTE